MKKVAHIFLFLLVISSGSIFGQADLDTSFNSSGKMVVGGFLAFTEDIAVQPDNKIVFVSRCSTIDGPYNICLGRRNEDGSQDATFGNSPSRPGFVLTRITGTTDTTSWQANGVAIQNDGKIVVVGSSAFGSSTTVDIVVVRYNANGTIDTAFGTNGVARGSYSQKNIGEKVVIQPDGKIVVVGYIEINTNNSQYQQLIARFNADGTIDQTFSGDGYVNLQITDSFTGGADIALQPDGKILTGGALWTNYSSLLIRLNADGSFDTTFDGDGIKTVASATPLSFYEGFISVAVESDGKILGLSSDKKLYRFNSDGSPDNTFDTDGSRSVLSVDSRPKGLTVTPSGKITVVGERVYCNCSGISYNYHVGKYLPDGSADTNFDGDGYLEIDISAPTNDFGVSAAYDAKGRIVLGGISATGTVLSPYENATWSFARLIAAPAQNVGFTGRVTDSTGRAVANAYITLKNGSEVIGYARTNPFGYFRFANVPTNITYTLSTVSKNLNFYDQNVLVDGAIENFWISAN